MSPRPAFWKKGVRFKCLGCGKCCQARDTYGFVYLTKKDRQRLALHLQLSEKEFRRKYCEETDGWTHLKNPRLDCGFFKNNGCEVYEARPEQCRTWPFWPENMNARAWRSQVLSFCRGASEATHRARLYAAEEIQSALARDPVNPKESE
ncbi:MAG: hypothetical protein A2X94_07510 [Bdellovibrionales bacterium GWB1_55_8]|nr:MAG: hypothetical protein A2X94_07510 [Bdellovibrionales bacterium GWB1_55_8]